MLKRAFDLVSSATAIVQEAIRKLEPGLTGVGSIVFRDEEGILANSSKVPLNCFREDITPYRGALELWYEVHQGFFTDMSLVFLTAWAVLFSETDLHFKVLKNLPPKPRF